MPSYHHRFDSSHQIPRHGHSKAQFCFFKILHIISSVPPSHQPLPKSSPTGGIGIDLNLQFCSQDGEFQCDSRNGSGSEGNKAEEKGEDAGNESVRVEVDDAGVDREETEIEGEIRVEKDEDEGDEKKGGGENEYNCLDLLIEAARVISGKEESKIEEARRSEAKESWMVVKLYSDETEEKSPVVRTKRGRSQALPYRFRDSVMEPLKRTGRPPRPSSTATASRKRLIGS